MEPVATLGSLLLAGVFIGLAFLIGLAGYRWYFNPTAVTKRAIMRQAKADYQRARGTAHLRLLRETRTRVNSELAKHGQDLLKVRNAIAGIEDERTEELRSRLEYHIVHHRLTEVPGIGTKFRDHILESLRPTRLEDLREAYRVHGVGQSRQDAIDSWVYAYESRMPDLLEQNFPGKQQILAEYARKASDLGEQITRIEEQQTACKERLAQLDTHISALEKVTVLDFVTTITKGPEAPEAARNRVDGYLRGLFCEWEPVPDWFKELVATE